MGIFHKYHNKGIGSMMLNKIEKDFKNKGFKYIEVKTLDESRESEEYKKTRLFYIKNAFFPIDVLFNEWGEDNPCLVMLKEI